MPKSLKNPKSVLASTLKPTLDAATARVPGRPIYRPGNLVANLRLSVRQTAFRGKQVSRVVCDLSLGKHKAIRFDDAYAVGQTVRAVGAKRIQLKGPTGKVLIRDVSRLDIEGAPHAGCSEADVRFIWLLLRGFSPRTQAVTFKVV